MKTALWIVSGLLATAFLFAGLTKLVVPRDKLAKAPNSGWTQLFSARFIKVLGALEVLAAVGLILPVLLGIAPILTPLAAVGIGIIMIGAAVVVSRLHEYKHALVNVAYLALAAFVAVGRFAG